MAITTVFDYSEIDKFLTTLKALKHEGEIVDFEFDLSQETITMDYRGMSLNYPGGSVEFKVRFYPNSPRIASIEMVFVIGSGYSYLKSSVVKARNSQGWNSYE